MIVISADKDINHVDVDLRKVTVRTQDELRFTILVDDSRTRLQPDPVEIFSHQPVCNQTGTASLDHCSRRQNSWHWSCDTWQLLFTSRHTYEAYDRKHSLYFTNSSSCQMCTSPKLKQASRTPICGIRTIEHDLAVSHRLYASSEQLPSTEQIKWYYLRTKSYRITHTLDELQNSNWGRRDGWGRNPLSPSVPDRRSRIPLVLCVQPSKHVCWLIFDKNNRKYN